MKLIKLAAPTVVNTNPRGLGDGELRHPIEGALTVCDAEAERLRENRLLDGEPGDVEVEESEEDGDGQDGLDAMTLPDLHLLVTKEGVPLNGVTKKAEIVAAIRQHREETSR